MSLDVLIANESAREAVMAALEVPPPLGKLLLQYVGLFRPTKYALGFDRVASLLNELLPMLKENVIERNGITYPAPLPYWREAIEQMLAARERLVLPLKSHGYLLEIIAGIASKTAGKAEARREEKLQTRTTTGGMRTTYHPEEEKAPAPQLTPERKQELLGTLKTFKGPARMPSREEQLRALEQATAGNNQAKEQP